MNKEVYCNELKGMQLYDDKMGVTGAFIFKNSMTQEEMFKTKNANRLFLVDKDYKQALIDIREYCNSEINEIQNHQYAVGVKRLKKILQIIDKALGDEK